MKIDIEKLREDLKNDSLGAFFGGGFGGALMEAADVKYASDDELKEIARRKGVDLRNYLSEDDDD
ncbi:MAG: hypothetical protein Q4D24_08395 [Erysipelotrichaceae bacterium]|nr:hypothetical protein [Erysipelotrichaceae bacterium]